MQPGHKPPKERPRKPPKPPKPPRAPKPPKAPKQKAPGPGRMAKLSELGAMGGFVAVGSRAAAEDGETFVGIADGAAELQDVDVLMWRGAASAGWR